MPQRLADHLHLDPVARDRVAAPWRKSWNRTGGAVLRWARLAPSPRRPGGAWRSLPYRVRRRSGDAEARLVLTEDISRVQPRIAFYQALLRIEEPVVAVAYEELVRSAKRQVGEQMREA
ncbi:hypothetical protein GCM10009546_02130 [Actinomadura livida]|uniref:DUF5753 domain-containing protein n=1 Tax=Actinomadura livida TaxID=79909 RepID=A0ABP3NGH1_9ACTN|nr:hypothetical protein GCM10010208_28370 [Actinomadura livida]